MELSGIKMYQTTAFESHAAPLADKLPFEPPPGWHGCTFSVHVTLKHHHACRRNNISRMEALANISRLYLTMTTQYIGVTGFRMWANVCPYTSPTAPYIVENTNIQSAISWVTHSSLVVLSISWFWALNILSYECLITTSISRVDRIWRTCHEKPERNRLACNWYHCITLRTFSLHGGGKHVETPMKKQTISW